MQSISTISPRLTTCGLCAAVRIGRRFADQDQAAVIAAAERLVRRGDHRVDVGGVMPSRVRSPA